MASQLGCYRRAIGVLQAIGQIACGLLDPLVLGAGVAVARFVAFMWQAGFGLIMAAGKGLSLFWRIALWLRTRVGLVDHQKKNHMMTNANAGTPSNHAMKYLPMACFP